MDKKMFLQILNEAQLRSEDSQLPLEARINSLETVNLCMQRASKEGWVLDRPADKWIFSKRAA
ncbi:hypothetical protein [Cronobacter malonaticus]|uniref:hypothetical protein n=1 Tax=Cronobacter malonaticus TaxID=413503 RepID=UPI0009B8E932|nr:hypothetical protein [Cronobacter malonaticus]NCH31127.1 hypothetical protein [Cronobacter malonaticus]